MNSVTINASDTGFSLEKNSDPSEHGKKIFFYPQQAESILEAITKYIKIRDSIAALNTENGQ